jgi:hypothetical protein
MATVSDFVRSGGKGNPGRKPYFVETVIDMAEAATAKGSALASSDVLEAITVPEGHVVMWAGLECTETPSGGTGTVLDLGITGNDPDRFVDGFAFDSASAGDYATLANTGVPLAVGSEDTIDVLIQAASTVSTSGKVRVYAVLMEVGGVGSDKGADEVQRDVIG